jgi:hypothetical protein
VFTIGDRILWWIQYTKFVRIKTIVVIMEFFLPRFVWISHKMYASVWFCDVFYKFIYSSIFQFEFETNYLKKITPNQNCVVYYYLHCIKYIFTEHKICVHHLHKSWLSHHVFLYLKILVNGAYCIGVNPCQNEKPMSQWIEDFKIDVFMISLI